MHFLAFVPILFSVGSALHFVQDHPGLIPDFDKQVSKLLGGWRYVDLRDEEKNHEITRLVQLSLADLQKDDSPHSMYAALLKVDKAIEQVERNTTYKVIFQAQQKFRFQHQAREYGLCYMEMFVSHERCQNVPPKLGVNVCIEIPPNDAKVKKSSRKFRRY